MIFIDTDILLDVAFKRVPFWLESAALLNRVAKGDIQAGTTPLVLANCLYIIQRQAGPVTANEYLELALQFLEEIPLTFTHQKQALASNFKDKEDAFNYFACLDFQVEAIITRNQKDFRMGILAVYTPKDFLARIDHR